MLCDVMRIIAWLLLLVLLSSLRATPLLMLVATAFCFVSRLIHTHSLSFSLCMSVCVCLACLPYVCVDAYRITSLSVSAAVTGVATGPLALNGAPLGDGTSIKAAFARAGQCGTPSERVGEAFVDVGAHTLPSVTFAYNDVLFVCLSYDSAQSWSQQQATVNIAVSTSTLLFRSLRASVASLRSSCCWLAA